MKNLLKLSLILVLVLVACKVEKKEKPEENETPKTEFVSFGDKITSDKVLSSIEAFGQIKGLQIGDTLNLKFASKINEVCTSKGCWMKLSLAEGEEAMVRFKDYGFFMPLDSKGNEVIVEGKAFVNETSVDELRHYAEDAGKAKEEIEKIIESKTEFTFLAHGVLMK